MVYLITSDETHWHGVMAQAGPDEVLVSRVVTDLVAGAGLKFFDRGTHQLKGLPGRWDLFAASA
jgi:hypothetical protein